MNILNQCVTDSVDASIVRPKHEKSEVSTLVDDAHIVLQIDLALRATGYLALLNLEFVATGGVVVLRGRLPRYYLKQVVHAAVRAISGVHRIHDELEIVSVRL
jgi:osmotically-inducible protein OsmY